MKTVILMPHGEDTYRFYYDRERQRLRPDVVIVDRSGAIAFEINEAGLKGDGFDPARKLAVVWGDSVVFGSGQGWPCLIDAMAPGWQFLNGGIEGDLFRNILARAAALNRKREVSLNLVMLGWHPFPDNRGLHAALDDFLRLVPNTVLLTMPTALNRDLIERDLSPYLTERFAPDEFLFCGNIPYSPELAKTAFAFICERNAIAGEAAAAAGVRLVDLYAEFDTAPVADFRHDFHDIVHLRGSAYPKIAQAVYAGIADLLQPDAGAAVALRGSPARVSSGP